MRAIPRMMQAGLNATAALWIAAFSLTAIEARAVEPELERLRDGPIEMQSNAGGGKGLALVESRNQMVVLTEKGAEPANLSMAVADSALFFLNKTSDSLLTMEIDFGKNETHCASTNLTIGEDNVIRSTKPFPPRDFASICFHDAGVYPYKIYGIRGRSSPLAGTIEVK